MPKETKAKDSKIEPNDVYPKIRVQVLRQYAEQNVGQTELQENSKVIKLIITIQTAPNKPLEVQETVLTLEDKERFELKLNHAAHPEDNLKIYVSNTGELICEGQTEGSLEFQTESDVFVVSSLKAKRLSVQANALHNKGLLYSERCELDARKLINTGYFLSKHLEGNLGYQNNNSGETVLKNSGLMIGDERLWFRCKGKILNDTSGKMLSKRSLKLYGRNRFQNKGKISSPKLRIQSKYYLRNEANAVISCDKLSMSAYKKEVRNTGLILAKECQFNKAESFFNEGKFIVEGKLVVPPVKKAENKGQIIAGGGVEIYSEDEETHAPLSEILSDGTIVLKTLGGRKIAGHIHSQSNVETQSVKDTQIDLKAKVESGKFLSMIALQNIRNLGILEGENSYIKAMQDLVNGKEGAILAKEKLEVVGHKSIEQAGEMRAKEIVLETLNLKNTGAIISLKTLSMNVRNIFEHCESGVISATEAITILSRNLYLLGKMISKRDIDISVDNTFDYAPESLWAAGLLRLMFKHGFDFTKPLTAEGDLKIESEQGDIAVHNKVQSKKNTTILTRYLTVEKEGGVFAGEELAVTTSENVRVGTVVGNPTQPVQSDNAYLASQKKMSVKAKLIQNVLGEIYTNDDLILEALYRIDNYGNMTSGGNAKIIAPLFSHRLFTWSNDYSGKALSEKPRMTVSKTCNLIGDTDVLGGVIHVGENLKYKGNFHAHSFEAFRAWYDMYMVKGPRKGPGRGHYYHPQYIPRHQTETIFDSHISAGGTIHGLGQRFSNCGAFRAGEKLDLHFKEFQNGNHIIASHRKCQDDSRIGLARYFKENALFGKKPNASTGEAYFSAKVPLRYDLPLASKVILAKESEEPNPVAEALFEPIIEKDLVQMAFQDCFRSGFADGSGSPEKILQELRNEGFLLSQRVASNAGQNSGQNPNSQGKPHTIREQDLAISEKALLFYRSTIRDGRSVLEPELFIPPKLKQRIALGAQDEAVMRAKNISLEGEQGTGSSVNNSGVVAADEVTRVKADSIRTVQRTKAEYELATINRKKGSHYVSTVKEIGNTGVWRGNSISMTANQYQQIGGLVSSGPGGTELIIRDEALIQALRTTEVVQQEITRGGRNYQIEPVFLSAKLTSLGTQTIIVTEGRFRALGMESRAAKKNTIKAKYETEIKDVKESFELASTETRGGFLGLKRTVTGGSSAAVLSSCIEGGEGVELTSEQDSVRLIGSLIISSGDTSIRAKKLVEILSDTVQTQFYRKQSKFKGFNLQRQKVMEQNERAIQPGVLVQGNLHVNAGEQVNIKGLQGSISGDVSIEALNVIIEGVVEKQTVVTKTQSLGVSFFGSNMMESIMRGENAKQALNKLLENDSFVSALKSLVVSKDTSEKLNQSMLSFVEGFRLLGMVAHACNETNLDPNKGDVVGALTDRWGLTTPVIDKQGKIVDRKFNPNFKFTYTQSKSVQTTTRTLPTTLMIGGNLHIVGDVVKVLDGAQIEAENITIHARRLLEIQAAKNSSTLKESSQSVSASFRADGSFEGASVNASQHHSESVHYQNARIKARGVLTILSQGTVALKGAELDARRVSIQAAELLLQSLQDRHSESGHSFGASVGTDFDMTGVNASEQQAESRWTHAVSRIHAEQSLELFVDHLLQIGSVLSSEERLRIQGLHQQHPIHWHVEDLHDFSTNESTGINLNIADQNNAFPLTGFINHKQGHKEGVTRATVAAPQVEAALPANINRSTGKVQEVLADKQKSIGVPVVVPNLPKLNDELAEVQKLFEKGKEAVGGMLQQPKPALPVAVAPQRNPGRSDQPGGILSPQPQQQPQPQSDAPSGSVPGGDKKPLLSGVSRRGKKIRNEKNKNRQKANRELETGEYSKPALTLAKQERRKLLKVEDPSVKATLVEGELLWASDLHRRQLLENEVLNVSAGLTPYAGVNASVTASKKRNQAGLSATATAGVGFNVLTGELSTKYANGQMQLDVLMAKAQASFNLYLGDKNKVGGDVNLGAMANVASAKAKIATPKVELGEYTMQCQVDVGAHALGVGGNVALGAQMYKTRPGGSFYYQVGALPGLVGATVGVHCEVGVKEKVNNSAPKP